MKQKFYADYVTTGSEHAPKHRPKLNWIWIILCAVFGCAAVGWAWSLVRDDGSNLPGFWSGVLINVGTSILLAGVLFWLERRFVKETGKIAMTAATEAANQTGAARAELDKRLAARISDLEDRLHEQRAEQKQAEDEIFITLSQDASYKSVFAALKKAYEKGAITGQGLTVPASHRVASPPLVTFRYRPGWRNEDGDGEDEGIELSRGKINGFPNITIPWSPSLGPTDVFRELIDQMTFHGEGPDANLIKIEPAFRHLGQTLHDAVSSRGDESSWLSHAAAVEVIADGWVITQAGLEVKGHGIVLDAEDFQNHRDFISWDKPDPPEWAGKAEWFMALNRGSTVFRQPDPWPSEYF